jgi:hypothetical protein
VPVTGSSATGTTVHFCPDEAVQASGAHMVIDAVQFAGRWPKLSVEIRHEQDS